MNWIEVCITTKSEAVEIVSGFLYELNITNLLIEDTSDMINFLENNNNHWDYIDEELINNKDDDAYIKFYVSEDIDGKEKLVAVKNNIQQLKNLETEFNMGTLELSIINVSEDDWADNWKKYYKPLRIGNRIIIKPTWEEYVSNDNDLVIEMDPGMAFGTGTHETTAMCIESLEKYINKDDIVFDIGCGSGILSLTSAVLSAKKVIGIDFDSVAVEVAKENVIRNNLNDKIEILCGNLISEVNFKANVIVSNIVADVIIKLAEDIKKFILPNGIFISSGIIKERLDDVKLEFLNQSFEILEINTKGEWVSIVVRVSV